MVTILRHGAVCAADGKARSYYGWPSVARRKDGSLVAVSSGNRVAHICPWGETTLWTSKDAGRTWSDTQVIQSSPIDDRDAGVITLPDGRLLVTWFTSDTRIYADALEALPEPQRTQAKEIVASWDDAMMERCLGAFVMTGTPEDGWDDPVEIGLTTPHGPIVLKNGDLFFFGKGFVEKDGLERPFRGADYPRPPYRSLTTHLATPIVCAVSHDGGRNWETLSEITELNGFDNTNLHEPHVIELNDGRLLGVIRTQWSPTCKFHKPFSMAVTFSSDGGRTWTPLKPLDVSGSPPHLLRHSSGKIILTYAYRAGYDGPDIGCGQRVLLSEDEGETWSDPIILREDGPDSDLGYPGTVELDDGTLMTVYYQKRKAGEAPSILYTNWSL